MGKAGRALYTADGWEKKAGSPRNPWRRGDAKCTDARRH